MWIADAALGRGGVLRNVTSASYGRYMGPTSRERADRGVSASDDARIIGEALAEGAIMPLREEAGKYSRS